MITKNQSLESIIELWSILNHQIWRVMQKQNGKSLSLSVEIEPGKVESLEWLMDDYIVHLEYHLGQIKSK